MSGFEPELRTPAIAEWPKTEDEGDLARPGTQAYAEGVVPVGVMIGKTGTPKAFTFDPKSPEGREMYQRCEVSDTLDLGENLGAEFSLKHVYASVVVTSPKEGKPSERLTKLCLISSDGRIYHTFSSGVADSLRRIFECHGAPLPECGVRVRIIQKTFPGPVRKYFLVEVFDGMKEEEIPI
jgi:hypothetical protein